MTTWLLRRLIQALFVVLAMTVIVFIGSPVPSFGVGRLLIVVCAVHLGGLPSTARGATRELLGIQWSFLTRDGLAHMIMRALNRALGNIALPLRLTRAGVRENLPM